MKRKRCVTLHCNVVTWIGAFWLKSCCCAGGVPCSARGVQIETRGVNIDGPCDPGFRTVCVLAAGPSLPASARAATDPPPLPLSPSQSAARRARCPPSNLWHPSAPSYRIPVPSYLSPISSLGCSEAGEVPPFQFVEINGLRLPSPQHAYSALYEVRAQAGLQSC